MNTPTAPGLYLFKGYRRSHPSSVEIVHQPVEVIEVWRGREPELAVTMLGRQARFPLSRFEGTFLPLVLDEDEVTP